MTALSRSKKPETPQQRREKVERLVDNAALWTPDTEPTDFVQAAFQKIEAKEQTNRRGWRWLAGSPRRLLWGFGTVSTAGVACALALFAVVGKMPVLNSDAPVSQMPAAVQEMAATSQEETITSNGPGLAGQERETATTPAPMQKRVSSSLTNSSSGKNTGRVGRMASSERVRRNASRRVRYARTVTPEPARTETRPVAQPVQKPAPSMSPSTTPEASRIAATPAPEIYQTEDGRMLVPVVITHASEDGSEVSYTPAVVEMAYQPPMEGTSP